MLPRVWCWSDFGGCNCITGPSRGEAVPDRETTPHRAAERAEGAEDAEEAFRHSLRILRCLRSLSRSTGPFVSVFHSGRVRARDRGIPAREDPARVVLEDPRVQRPDLEHFIALEALAVQAGRR